MIVLFAFICGCGGNPFAAYEKKEPAEDATIALEQGNPTKAINILTNALDDDPNNYQLVSLLGLAYAERAGINALTVVQKMASNASSSSGGSGNSSTNGVVSLFSVMPEASDQNILDIDTAVTVMLSIPNESRTQADKLKIGMYQTAALTLRTKRYDLDGDGSISAAEALAMSQADATTILSQLSSAASVFGGSSTSSVDTAAASQITSIQTAIGQCPGASQEDKLKNYMGKTGC
jgi:hypothetical protein